jgi:LCP family protein required for cell wall assembly
LYRPTGVPPARGGALSYRRKRSRPPLRPFFAVALVVALILGGIAVARVVDFVGHFGSPLAQVGETLHPTAGSIPWKLRQGERVNVLLLGYGGSENDAPYLTDTMMVMAIDPAGGRAMEVSIPRDLVVGVDAFAGRAAVSQKINAAYAIGRDDASWPGKRPEFAGARGGGGRLAMQTVGAITGVRFDGYVGIDFKAFRDLVDALGGVQVCLDGPLDDTEYPDYHDGYVRGGIHFVKGCQQVNGERALQLARSRHAVEAGEASDFARARRQQLLLTAIRRKAASVDGLARAPGLLNALQNDVDTNLGLGDLRAVYEWSGGVHEAAIGRAAVTATDFLDEFYQRAGCGDPGVYTLCPEDPSYGTLKAYFAGLFVDPRVLHEGAEVQVVNASRSLGELGDRVSRTLQPLGLRVGPPVRMQPAERTLVYDYSGGRYPQTARWLASYFGARVMTVPTTATPPTPNPPAGGLTVVLGHDYALRWIGQT